MKRVAREETAAQVVSRQSMEVCQILEEQNQLKTEYDPNGIVPLSIKVESQDGNQPGFTVTMDITSGTATPPPQREAPNVSSSGASAASECALLSEGEGPAPNGDARPPASSTSGYAGPSPPARARGRDFDSIATQSLRLKLELMQEERHVLRAMRQTAELNKRIAAKRLRQVLWLNRHERAMYSGEPGSGAGRGGGGGGAIREAGGTFGKMEAVREDEYFYKKQREQLASLKSHLKDEISEHEAQIKKHQEAIQRHKEKVAEIEKGN